MYYDFCLESKDFDFIFSGRVPELLKRFQLLKEFGITSYGTHYDDLPAFWVDALELMNNSYNQAVEWERKSLV